MLWIFKKNLNNPFPEKKIFIFCWADILLFVNWCWASVYYIFSLMPGNHLIISSVLDIVSPDPTGTKLKTEYLQPPTIATRNNLPAWICFLYILVELEKIFFFFLGLCVNRLVMLTPLHHYMPNWKKCHKILACWVEAEGGGRYQSTGL